MGGSTVGAAAPRGEKEEGIWGYYTFCADGRVGVFVFDEACTDEFAKCVTDSNTAEYCSIFCCSSYGVYETHFTSIAALFIPPS